MTRLSRECSWQGRLALIVTAALTALASVGVFGPTRALAIPVHPHGLDWTSFERDGDPGAGRVDHAHPAPGASENGDEAHQHYSKVPIPGPGAGHQPWGAYGVWDNRRGFVDNDAPFTDRPEYQARRLPHGFIQEHPDTMPRYRIEDEAGTLTATIRKLIRDAANLWGGIKADVSVETGKELKTGIGFRNVRTGDREIRIVWRDIPDASRGGQVTTLDVTTGLDGEHSAAAPVLFELDSSLDWDFTRDAATSDTSKFHFFSVALHEWGHVMFLEHSPTRDTDLMEPSVGEPLVNEGDFSYRWSGYVEAANEVDDRFTGRRFQLLSGGSIVSAGIEDRDSVDAIKSLYSIPQLPAPPGLLLLVAGLVTAGVGGLRRR